MDSGTPSINLFWRQEAVEENAVVASLRFFPKDGNSELVQGIPAEQFIKEPAGRHAITHNSQMRSC